ncbi:MerR family transcriptional regulator [Aquipuribacter nitratireducens]|uniref:MerR family transcriptional regulator n=1 Tax=Aquipuribacter nitratireducens TaxID=650104 RepID=A0ABW0GLC9_9MICO
MLIGEVARRSGVSARMLRHYDRLGLVTPSGRTAGGYRRYSDGDLERLLWVEALRSLGLRLAEVAAALQRPSFSPGPVVEQLVAQVEERLERDTELLHRLTRLRDSTPTDWDDVLAATALLRGLDAPDPSTRQRLALSLDRPAPVEVAVLVEALLTEPDPHVAGALTWALARSGDVAVRPLEAALVEEADDRRRRAVTALGAIRSTAATEALARLDGHVDPAVAAAAVLARGRRGDREVVPALVRLVRDGNRDVEAAEVLARLVDPDGVSEDDDVVATVVQELVGAPVAARRRLAAALFELPVPAAEAAATALRDDPDRGVAVTAAALLAGRDATVRGTRPSGTRPGPPSPR